MTAPLETVAAVGVGTTGPGDPFEGVLLAAVRAALEAIITVDGQHRIVMINPAAERLFGVPAAEALGSDISRFIPERVRQSHALRVREFAESGQPELRMSERLPVVGLRADGTEFPLEVAISRAESLGPQGRQVHFTALMRDLSEVRSLRSALDDFRRQMRAVSELTPVAMWVTEAQRVVFANRACARLFGAADASTLVGRSIFELMPAVSHSTLQRHLEQAQAGAEPMLIRERILTLDGMQRDVEVAIAALPDHGESTLQMVISDLTERQREQDALERSRRQLRRLAASQVQAREEERRRIARELHDELGQRLTTLKMELASVDRSLAQEPLHQRLAQMTEMVDQTIASLRHLAKDLRPAMLDDLGLNPAIEWLANDTARRLGIDVALRLDESETPLDGNTAITLYRIVQEALTNVARHARATRVVITLRRQADGLTLTVQDDGTGIRGDALGHDDSHGLLGMRERAYMLGGDLEIDGAPGGGVRLTVRVPMAGASPRRRRTDPGSTPVPPPTKP